MKRKIIYCTFALTATLLSGCTQNNTPGAEISSASDSGMHSNTSTSSADTAQTPVNHSASADTSHLAGQASPNAASNSTAQNISDKTNMISEDEAKQIALSHAGLTTDQATFIKSGTDRDNGRLNYDIEFYTHDHKEYDYEVNPYTGEILDVDYDAEYYPHSENTSGDNGTHTDNNITTDEAKQIALDKVPGATASDIREFKSDYDNGKLEYEGKIYYEQKEYEFELDGYTGEILEWDVEPIYGGIS